MSKGGSLHLWRDYFGPNAIIFGVDIDPACKAFDGEYGSVRIGSQDDPRFLTSVVEEMGGIDIVLDDGSHVSAHMRTSFDVLFPLLQDDGIYMIEDLHCCYWKEFGGGYRRRGSFIEQIKTMIDDMHHWYHQKGQKINSAKDRIGGIHIHDSLIIVEKAVIEQPVVSRKGR